MGGRVEGQLKGTMTDSSWCCPIRDFNQQQKPLIQFSQARALWGPLVTVASVMELERRPGSKLAERHRTTPLLLCHSKVLTHSSSLCCWYIYVYIRSCIPYKCLVCECMRLGNCCLRLWKLKWSPLVALSLAVSLSSPANCVGLCNCERLQFVAQLLSFSYPLRQRLPLCLVSVIRWYALHCTPPCVGTFPHCYYSVFPRAILRSIVHEYFIDTDTHMCVDFTFVSILFACLAKLKTIYSDFPCI